MVCASFVFSTFIAINLVTQFLWHEISGREWQYCLIGMERIVLCAAQNDSLPHSLPRGQRKHVTPTKQ